MQTKIKEILENPQLGQEVKLQGWIKTLRNKQFLTISDGSTVNHIQAVLNFQTLDEPFLKRLNTGAAVSITGILVTSLGKGQSVEVRVNTIEVIGDCDPEKFPLQPKKHSLEFLREIAHLRFRTQTFNAVFKIRHALSIAIHQFFNNRGFMYLHTPIITASDAEGAGEMFQVSTLDYNALPRNADGSVNYKEDFFGKPTKLTVSGQLQGELAALAFGEVYTFGPTFRAENSNTSRHLAEFWMVEPEMAFYTFKENMDLAEGMLKYLIRYILSECQEELHFLNKRFLEEERQKPQDKRSSLDLITKLHFCLEHPFERMAYTEAIEILKRSKENQKKQFTYPIEEWGVDLQSEHERYLVEKHCKKPVILTDYPADIKAFYMRQNEPDAQGRSTVQAMDILFPGIGEVVGGSQREERLDKLTQRMENMHIPIHELDWYLDTRRFGSVPHAGFGLGIERLVMFATGMTNIRDVIPFPRTPKNVAF